MATLTTKFDIGQTVWHANTTTQVFQHKCPDCSDARAWEATSPAGGVFRIPCPRCSVQYTSNDELRLNYTKFVPAVRPLTVGQIKASTAIGDDWDAGNSYMCCETGIGSGSIYRERDLFATEAEALTAAEAQAAIKNSNEDFWVAKQFNKTARFSDYQFKDALVEAAWDKARNYGYRVQYLLDDLKEADTIAQVREVVERWQEVPGEELEAIASARNAEIALCSMVSA